jgi:hypothetical protein
MKEVIPHLKSGQKVWAIIEEVFDGGGLIVNFHGDLVRVQNGTSRRFRPGQRIQLKVVGLSPLGFQLLESSSGQPYKRHLDINI